jgi:hypothetical protein
MGIVFPRVDSDDEPKGKRENKAKISDNKMFSVSILAIFAGLLYESLRISKDWKIVFKTECAIAIKLY